MANKSYHEIRATSLLVDYNMYFAGKYPIWIEKYVDENYEYQAIFSPDSTSLLPSTITQKEIE